MQIRLEKIDPEKRAAAILRANGHTASDLVSAGIPS